MTRVSPARMRVLEVRDAYAQLVCENYETRQGSYGEAAEDAAFAKVIAAVRAEAEPVWKTAFDALADSAMEHFGALPGDYDHIKAKAIRAEASVPAATPTGAQADAERRGTE